MDVGPTRAQTVSVVYDRRAQDRFGVGEPMRATRQSVRVITLAVHLQNRAVVGEAVQVRPRVSGSHSGLLSSRSLFYTGGRVPEPQP
jgi:hypothetical protein